MKPDFSKFTFWAAVAAGAACVLVLATLTFQSLFRLLGAQPEHEKTIPAAIESASSGQDVKSVADADEHPSVNPAPARTAPADNEFCTDSKVIRQQEQERQERVDNLRWAVASHDSNAVPPEKKLKQIEDARDL